MLATRIDDCLRSVPTCQLPAASTQQRTERSLNRVDGRRATGCATATATATVTATAEVQSSL